MEPEEIHDLTAGYALNALSREEELAFEEHLRDCEACSDEVAWMRDTVADLAHAAPAVALPPALRGRVLDQVRAERGNVVPLRPRWTAPVAAAAAVAACAAVAFGVWAAMLHGRLDARTSALHQRDQVLQVLADPATKQLALGGRGGSLYVTRSGTAALVLSRLPAAPAGKRYEAWVIAAGAARPAGLFAGGNQSAVLLSSPVQTGSRVGVTLEPSGGSSRPTGKLLVLSRRIA